MEELIKQINNSNKKYSITKITSKVNPEYKPQNTPKFMNMSVTISHNRLFAIPQEEDMRGMISSPIKEIISTIGDNYLIRTKNSTYYIKEESE